MAILWGGIRLGTREVSKRLVPDHEPMKAFAAELRRKLDRLDRLYESHLRRISESVELIDDFELRAECERLKGMQQVSVIHPRKRFRSDKHIQITGGKLVLPHAQGAEVTSPGEKVALSEQLLFGVDAMQNAGWIDEPGKPILFWARIDTGRAVVFRIDPVVVAEAMNAKLGKELKASKHAILSPGGKWDKDPDFLLPVHSRFAVWEMGEWDTFETKTTHDILVIAGSVTLASLLAGCGFIAFVMQRRSLRNAEQRVSFVNQVSHELRTPLTNIQLNADLAADGLNGSAPEVKRRISLVRDESQRLGRLIENVLTFSRSERGELDLHSSSVAPDDIIDEVLQQFAPALERRGIEIVREGKAPDEIELDADALSQVLANLVSNVEKYASEGKVLRISIEQSDGDLRITVADAGRGVQKRDRETIFEAFKRVNDSSNEGVSGTGLGLTIARDLTEKMGGSLTLEASDEGAVFVLSLPGRTVTT